MMSYFAYLCVAFVDKIFNSFFVMQFVNRNNDRILTSRVVDVPMSSVLQDIATVHEWKSPHRISSSSLFSRMIHCASLSKARVVTGIAIASVPFGSVNRPICMCLISEKCGM
jgi:hypothetical protein